MHELERDKGSLASDPADLSVIFKEMIQMCLWYAPVLVFNTILLTLILPLQNWMTAGDRGNATV